MICYDHNGWRDPEQCRPLVAVPMTLVVLGCLYRCHVWIGLVFTGQVQQPASSGALRKRPGFVASAVVKRSL